MLWIRRSSLAYQYKNWPAAQCSVTKWPIAGFEITSVGNCGKEKSTNQGSFKLQPQSPRSPSHSFSSITYPNAARNTKKSARIAYFNRHESVFFFFFFEGVRLTDSERSDQTHGTETSPLEKNRHNYVPFTIGTREKPARLGQYAYVHFNMSPRCYKGV